MKKFKVEYTKSNGHTMWDCNKYFESKKKAKKFAKEQGWNGKNSTFTKVYKVIKPATAEVLKSI